jgi:hypothetical protein
MVGDGRPWAVLMRGIVGYSWRPPQWKKIAVLKCSRLR